jgi:hypothetical protein
MTKWDQFRKLKAKDFQAYMNTPNIVDARRLYDPEEFRELSDWDPGIPDNGSSPRA